MACAIVAASIIPRGKRRRLAGGIAIAAVVAVGIVGTARSLLVPTGIGALALLVFGSSGRPWPWLSRCAAVAGAAITALLCWLFPMPEPPLLGGSHRVGTLTFEIPAEAAAPRLLVQVWYPSDSAGSGSPWLPDPSLSPGFPFHRLKQAKAHASQGVPVVDESARFPVIFYEHAWMGHRAENIAQVEDLASRGFVVVAADHPGQAMRVLYADGTLIEGNLPRVPDFSSNQAITGFLTTAEKCFNARERNLDRVLVSLSGPDAGVLQNRLLLDRVGVFGFSFGGSHAVRLCASHHAFHAGANEDGLFLGDDRPRGPFLFFDSELPQWLGSPPASGETPEQGMIRQAETRIQKALEGQDRRRVILAGVGHSGFTDAIFRSPLPRLAGTGSRTATEVQEQISKNLASFFSDALKRPGTQPVPGQ